jgi:hypothetical protein
MWLTALASLLPALATAGQQVLGHEDKAKTAATVAADPNAPPAVKAAAQAVAAKAIDDSAAVQKAALGAVAGKAPPSEATSNTTMLLLGLGAVLLLSKHR